MWEKNEVEQPCWWWSGGAVAAPPVMIWWPAATHREVSRICTQRLLQPQSCLRSTLASKRPKLLQKLAKYADEWIGRRSGVQSSAVTQTSVTGLKFLRECHSLAALMAMVMLVVMLKLLGSMRKMLKKVWWFFQRASVECRRLSALAAVAASSVAEPSAAAFAQPHQCRLLLLLASPPPPLASTPPPPPASPPHPSVHPPPTPLFSLSWSPNFSFQRSNIHYICFLNPDISQNCVRYLTPLDSDLGWFPFQMGVTSESQQLLTSTHMAQCTQLCFKPGAAQWRVVTVYCVQYSVFCVMTVFSVRSTFAAC